MIKREFNKKDGKMHITFKLHQDWLKWDTMCHIFAYHCQFPNAGDYAKVVIDGKLPQL